VVASPIRERLARRLISTLTASMHCLSRIEREIHINHIKRR
jgi:hypothetical protein